ncbi:MAG: class I adenylate-forming enzyme family protein [Actinomycetota bacterium]
MADLLARAAADFGDQVFLQTAEATLTFAGADVLVDLEARRLGELTGGDVPVAPRRTIESVVEVLAVIRAGARAVLVGPDWPPAMVAQHLSVASRDRQKAATVLFTSGSSGRAKGVRLLASNWESAARGSSAFFGFGPGDRWLVVLPLHHVGGLSVVFRALASGGTAVMADRLEPAGLAGAELASLVPTHLTRLGESPPRHRLRALVVGGGPIPSELLATTHRNGWPAISTYGMTETAAVVASGRVDDPRLFALPGVEIDTDNAGRIRVRGPQVSPGYLGGSVREPGAWLVTADLGRVAADGSIEVLGRSDRVIISGGEKVDAAAVEEVIAGHPGVLEVAVLGRPDPEWGETVVAVYVGEAALGQLEDLARVALAPNAVPKRFIRVEEIPRTELGKVDLARLADLNP